MNELLRRSKAHVLVDDVGVPQLDDRSAHHLIRVLRVSDGEPVTVTDGAGRWRPCVMSAGALESSGPVETVPSSRDPFSLYVAIPKQDRPDWLVQKATELGADRIVFLHAERSVVRWAPDRAEKHRVKLERVAIEAAMQSRRVWLPVIAGPVPVDEVLGDPALGVVVAEPGGRPMAPTDRAVAVGPEGGWSDRELALAADTVSLGPLVLRVETAALAACAVAHLTE